MNDKDDRSIEDELMARAAKLPEAITPERDLWLDIEPVITAPLKAGAVPMEFCLGAGSGGGVVNRRLVRSYLHDPGRR